MKLFFTFVNFFTVIGISSIVFFIQATNLAYDQEFGAATNPTPAPYTPLRLQFYFNKTSVTNICDDDTFMSTHETAILSSVVNLLDLPHYRLVSTRDKGAGTTTSKPKPVLDQENVLLRSGQALQDSKDEVGRHHKTSAGEPYCFVEFRCVQDFPWIEWWGVDYDCFQIVGLIVAMPLDMKREMLAIEDFGVVYETQNIPEDDLNATKSLATLPPAETKYSQPVQYDPASFWVCMLEDPVLGDASAWPKLVSDSHRDGNVDEVHFDPKTERVVEDTEFWKAFFVGNVTSAMHIHLNADPALVVLDPVPLPKFVVKDTLIPPSPDPSTAPRFIAFKVIPNQTDFNASKASYSTTSAPKQQQEQQQQRHQETENSNRYLVRSFGNRIHKRIIKPPKNSTNHFFPKTKASPDDAAATSVVLSRTDREDTVFSTGYSCYPYNQSLSADNASMTNFTATNASVDFIPLYTFPVFIEVDNETEAELIFNLDENENGNFLLETKLSYWWETVIEAGGADMRVVPLYVTEASRFYVEMGSSSTSTSSSRKVLFFVTVGPIETRVNITTNEKIDGNFVDTVGSCIFSWMNPAVPESNFVKDLSLVFLGMFSVGMLAAVVVVVVWGSMEVPGGGHGHDHGHGGGGHHEKHDDHSHKNSHQDEHDAEKQRKKSAGEYYLSASLLKEH